VRRSPTILLCLLCALPALAQGTTPAPATSPSSTPAPAEGEAKDGEKKDEKQEEKQEEKKDEPINARLAPGGVVAGGNAFPLHAQLTLDNALGNGVFAPGYQQQVNWSSSLSIRLSAALPKADWAPRMLLSGGTDFSVNNWLPEFSNSGAFDRQITVGDASVALIMPGIYREEFTGIGMSLILSGRAPLSMGSRQQNLIFNGGGAAQFMWGSPETPIGSFFVQYTPTLRFSAYSELGASIPCAAATPVRTKPSADPIDGITELPLYYGREEQVLPNGECILPGRQPIASIGQNGATGWTSSDGAHNVTMTLAWAHSFVRPLKNEPALSSPFASGQNFNESTSGSLSYTYTVPVDFNFFITGGVFSSQPIFMDNGTIRFPLYDFVTPANNLSAFFLDFTVGI
jgi:hypothetical protein